MEIPGGYPMLQDDPALIEAFQAGDEFAFVTLYNHYKGPVYSFAYKFLLDRDLAQDVLQETFLRVYENRSRLVRSAAFKPWMFTIARNQCLNHLRRLNKLDGLDEEPVASISDTPGALFEKSDEFRLVNRILGWLKPDYREIIVLREYQNLSYEEIAAVTRSTVSAVKSKLFKARRRMAELMQQSSGEPRPAPLSAPIPAR